ncbi:DUF397 domain-containing protein [Actinomadura macrotermitis]|uniref:DUF397 domain-containing protein n=1 Tax=Actinomadura macrotermitis TaxID=2585200 RepID=A0A7K0BY22_9ACTN|nr:DUF397 domain-containing protein [Actinomadura macrotermitis]MQY06069.1 hypothetical protein [Actinomadura macrotermitis]
MTPVWRKSSHSGTGHGGQSDCVEIAALGQSFGVRDSKAPGGGHLTLTPADFAALMSRLKHT